MDVRGVGARASRVAAAQDAEADGRAVQTPVWTTTRRTIELFPAGDVFPVYVADPHRPTNQIATAFYSRSRIPDTASPRFLLAAGGRFGLLRLGGTTPDRWAWQLSVEAGLDADLRFDAQERRHRMGRQLRGNDLRGAGALTGSASSWR